MYTLDKKIYEELDTFLTPLPQVVTEYVSTSSNLIMPEKDFIKILPTNSQSVYDFRYNKLTFQINSNNILDPYSLYLYVKIINEKDHDLQLDGSAHSLIQEITVMSGGVIIENIKDYDVIKNLEHDFHLGPKRRKARKYFEGFGDNRYGTNELYIPQGKNSPLKMDFVNKIRTDLGNDAVVDTFSVYSKHPFINKNDIDLYNDMANNKSEITRNPNNYFLLYPKRPQEEYIIPSINEWEIVKNGKLLPSETLLGDWVKIRNEKTFRIPLNLKCLGFGIPLSQYKMIPLEIFKDLTIVIQFSTYAFFVPMAMDEYQYLQMDATSKGYEHMNNFPNNQASREYQMKEVYIGFDQYRWSDDVKNAMLNEIRGGAFIIDSQEIEQIDQIYIKSFPTVVYQKGIDKRNVKAIYCTFTSDLHVHSPYARKSTRYNKGIQTMTFKHMGKMYPPNNGKVFNSLNASHDSENCDFFWNELSNSLGLYYPLKETIMSKANFALDFDASHAWGFLDFAMRKSRNNLDIKKSLNYLENGYTDVPYTEMYMKQNKIRLMYNTLLPDLLPHMRLPYSTDFGSKLANPASKAVYTICFEPIPKTGNGRIIKRGINFDIQNAFVIEFNRLLQAIANDESYRVNTIYHFLNVFVESYKQYQLTIDGQLILIS